MKTRLLVVVMVLAAVSFLAAQDATDSAIKALEQKWVTALEKGDAATLDKIIASTYVDTDEAGYRTDKQAALAALQSHDVKMTSIELSDLQVHAYGDAAVATGRAELKGTNKGQPFMLSIAFTDTFVKQGGAWKAVASQRGPSKSSSEPQK